MTTALPLAAFGIDRPVLAFEQVLRFPVAFGEAGTEEGLFGGGQLHRCRGDPAVHLFEETASEEVRVGAVGGDPFAHSLREPALDTDVVRAPSIQFRSRVHSVSNASCEISTVGLLRDRVAIEAQQAVATERVEHGAQQQAIDVEVFELAPEHSATRVLAVPR